MNAERFSLWSRLHQFVAVLLFIFLSVSNVNAANDKAFFWKVSSEKATVYLLGSIHFADTSFYPLRSEINNAFENSQTLVVELDVTGVTAERYNKLLATSGTYKNGASIEDDLSTETLSALHERLKLLGIEYASVKQLKPGVLVLTLTSVQLMQLGLDPALGIDLHFLNMIESAAESKEVVELESIEQQFNLFLDIADGDLLLKETLHSMEESEEMMADIIRYWKAGDEAAMNNLLFEDTLKEYPAFETIYESLFYERNHQMTKKIDLMLSRPKKTGNSYFVVVGSGHLIGEKGIVNALKKKGYQVERR